MRYTTTIPVEIEIEVSVDKEGEDIDVTWSANSNAGRIATAIQEAIENYKAEIADAAPEQPTDPEYYQNR